MFWTKFTSPNLSLNPSPKTTKVKSKVGTKNLALHSILAPPGAQEVALSVCVCVCSWLLGFFPSIFPQSLSPLLAVFWLSFGCLLAVFQFSLSSVLALSFKSLVLSFLIHFINLRAYFIKPAEHKILCLVNVVVHTLTLSETQMFWTKLTSPV